MQLDLLIVCDGPERISQSSLHQRQRRLCSDWALQMSEVSPMAPLQKFQVFKHGRLWVGEWALHGQSVKMVLSSRSFKQG